MEQYPIGIDSQEIGTAMKDRVNLAVEKRLYTLDETRQVLGGISLGTVHNLRKRKQLRILKIGSRSFVKKEEIERFLADLSDI